MARHIPSKDPVAAASGGAEEAELTAEAPGGAPGVLPEPVRVVHIPGTVSPAANRELPNRPAVEARRFRVVAGGPVLYDSARVDMRTGKIIADNQYDLDLLRRQGIVLEEVNA
jgi:hypothetical protein